MQNLNTQLLQKVSIKPKYSNKENIILYSISFATMSFLLFALCYTSHLIDTMNL